ncbi:hypothetical protein CBR_g22274 [Chara braunii]|uniref:Uncharacterized protein n=1 Tax=Chara braunii TaxID=69332 RepID=A0A388L2L3_CHABU|nr:hypothetical protein CBR_g22274 [Chara braunii]|eukprot:GBG76526.1 hypothetical protein CBR_g22274 [Chara braunii]
MREDQERVVREAEMKRIEDEAKKEAEKEARLAKMMDEKMEMEKKREEDNKKLWEKIGLKKGSETGTNFKAVGNGDNAKKRGQEDVAGAAVAQPSTPRQRVNEVGALDAGLLLMNLDNVQRTQVQQGQMFGRAQNQQNLMFQRVIGLIDKIEASHRGATFSAAIPTHVGPSARVAAPPAEAPSAEATVAGGSNNPSHAQNVRTTHPVAPCPTAPSHPQHPNVVIPPPPPPPPPHAPPFVPPIGTSSSPPAPQSLPRASRLPDSLPPPPAPSNRRAPGVVIKEQFPRTANHPITHSMAPNAAQQDQGDAGPSRVQADTPNGRSTGRLAEVFASVAGTARRMSSSSSSMGASPGLGFDRLREGIKAIVANPGAGGRRQYREEMEKFLMGKYKNELVELSNKDEIKYHNKKQAVVDITAIRVNEAYGDEDEEEDRDNDTTEETQEENPS